MASSVRAPQESDREGCLRGSRSEPDDDSKLRIQESTSRPSTRGRSPRTSSRSQRAPLERQLACVLRRQGASAGACAMEVRASVESALETTIERHGTRKSSRPSRRKSSASTASAGIQARGRLVDERHACHGRRIRRTHYSSSSIAPPAFNRSYRFGTCGSVEADRACRCLAVPKFLGIGTRVRPRS